jgi:hypothetical protein
MGIGPEVIYGHIYPDSKYYAQPKKPSKKGIPLIDSVRIRHMLITRDPQ